MTPSNDPTRDRDVLGDDLPPGPSVQRGGTCDVCPDIRADLREVKSKVQDTREDIKELKDVLKGVFQKLDSMFVSVAHHDAALAVLAEKVKAETKLMTEKQVSDARTYNTIVSAVISLLASVLVAYISYKLKG